MCINMKKLLDKMEERKINNYSNEIRITINKPSKKVFEFVLEPNNTHLWCKDIKQETIDTEQIGLNTIYINNFGKLRVTDYERNVYFELSEIDTEYQCSYSFKKIDENTTELIYFEGMLDGSELSDVMDFEDFEKLKELLEKQ